MVANHEAKESMKQWYCTAFVITEGGNKIANAQP